MKFPRYNFKKIPLPYFPDDDKLRKYWWHRAVKLIALIVSVSCLYSILWLLALFFLPFDFSDFNKLLAFPAYLPMEFANFFTRFPFYGTLFMYSLRVPILGPLALTFFLITVLYFLPSFLYRLALAIAGRFYMKKVKFMLISILLLIFWFSFSTWKFQQLVNEGSFIADEQCLKVNPLIIERKNYYIDSMKIVLASGSADEYWDKTNKYLDTSKRYVNAQKEWLSTQKAYINSSGFNTFVPSYVREAAKAQYDSREAEVKVTNAVIELFESYLGGTLTEDRQSVLSNTISEETENSRETEDKYNKMYDNAKGKFDLRNSFVSVPKSKCPKENFNIPDVNDLFNPKPMPLNGYPVS